MDMDDIPDPDELEWLESNAIPPEEDDFDDYYPEDFEPPPQPQPPQPTLPDPSPPPPPDPPATKKRALPDSLLPCNEKRNRLAPEAEIHRDEAEEDWLRYEPEKERVEETGGAVVEEERFVFRFASEIEGSCIPVTGPGGERVYAKMDQWEMNDSSTKKLCMKGYDTGLISEPISVLIDKMEQETLTKALQASSEAPVDLLHHEAPVVSEKLWVEKYAPSSFTELLSDEQTNREVLLWLKQWDSCVFGSDIRSTTEDVLSALKRHSSNTHHNKLSDTSFTSKNRRPPFTSTTYINSSNFNHESNYVEGVHGSQSKKSRAVGPPEHKVLLLCGPPGLGKTTLAHVAAKHCGYRVVEINASDDRASSTIEAKIIDVVQMNSIISDGKPKCLVIDEIDGALGEGKGAVEVILKMIAADKKSEAGKGDGSIKGPSRKRSKTTLSRPVICICNDLYAPALRQLRQIAKVHVFVQPTINRVVNRLKFICNKEGFRTSSISLTALAEYTECDIRSCLNTLQFLNKRKEQLNLLELGSQVVGRKDVSRSAFDVWKEIFQKRKIKRERKSMNNCSAASSDFDFIHSLVSNRGEYELTMDGIHENMLQLHYHDPMMQKTVNCLNTLGVSDYLHQYIMRTQQMSLLAYQPSTAIAIRSLISQIEHPHIEWPKSFYRYRTLFAEKKDLLRCWQSKITPFLSRHLSISSFVEDSLSPLLYVLSPPTLRPISLHLRSEREKGVLTQLVDTMVSYSITYKIKKVEPLPGSLRHDMTSEVTMVSLDPPVDEFISFKEYKSDHFELNPAMKQVLVHEIEKQRSLQRSTEMSQTLDAGTNSASQALPRDERANMRPPSGSNAYRENNMMATKDKLKSGESALRGNGKGNIRVEPPRVGKRASAAASSFFDRFRRRGCGDSQDLQSFQKQATLERDSRPLLFKFNEGFTNAVKRPVRVRDLLL